MDVLPELVTVFVAGALELWAAIPAGFALGLPPLAIGITSALGAFTSVLIIALLGDRARAWLGTRHGAPRDSKDHATIRRIWARYGLVGYGLLAPLLVGAALGTALGLVLGVPVRRLLLWMGVGIVIWTALLTVAVSLGLAGFETLGT